MPRCTPPRTRSGRPASACGESACGPFLGGAGTTGGAQSEQLQGVRDVGEAVLAGDAVGPAFHSGPLDLDGACARATHQVVVMPGTAPPVEGLPGAAAQDIDGS